jgi:hypothetical protein
VFPITSNVTAHCCTFDGLFQGIYLAPTTSDSSTLILHEAKDKDKSTPPTTVKPQAREKSPAPTTVNAPKHSKENQFHKLLLK